MPVARPNSQALTELARRAILDFLVEKEMIGQDLATKMMSWRHAAGFSVDCSVRLSAEELEAKAPAETLVRYLAHPPFTESKARLSPDESTLIYTSKMNPMLGRNFELLEPLEAIARILSMVPPKSWQTVRYFAWYSNKARGMRKKRGQPGIGRTAPCRPASEYRQRWAQLVKRVWLDDPLVCEKCGSHMKIIAFLQDPPVIEKILRHLHLWEDPPPAAGPASRSPPEPEVVRFDEDGVCLDQTILL